jgi:hypothetical protein
VIERLAAQRFRSLHRRKRTAPKHRADGNLTPIADWAQ